MVSAVGDETVDAEAVDVADDFVRGRRCQPGGPFQGTSPEPFTAGESVESGL